MATRCPRGFVYDEGGICGCGAGHEDPAAQVDDFARLSRERRNTHSCATFCTGCGKPLEDEKIDHRKCVEDALAGARPN